MRYDPEHNARTRQRVLEEAAKVMRLKGVKGVGVAAVMARAGLTHGAFYAHFESKDELVAATMDRMVHEVRQRFATLTGEQSPADALKAYVEFYLSPQHRDSLTKTCPLPLLAAEISRMGAATRARFGDAVAQLTRAFAERIEALGRADAEVLASSIVAELVGAMALARGIPDRPQSDSVLSNSRRAVLARLGLKGSQA
jgi:TetR/AcrR family transcriptional repressor of nem operon